MNMDKELDRLENRLIDLEYEALKRRVAPAPQRGCYPKCQLMRIPGIGIRAVAKKGNRKYPIEGKEHLPCPECAYQHR